MNVFSFLYTFIAVFSPEECYRLLRGKEKQVMKWKPIWNRSAFYFYTVLGLVVVLFGFLAGSSQQRPLMVTFLVIVVLYVAGFIFLYILIKKSE